MWEIFRRIFGIKEVKKDVSPAMIEADERKNLDLEAIREKIRQVDTTQEDAYDKLIALGMYLAEERKVDFEEYSPDIYNYLRNENATLTEIILILAAYTSQAEIERMEKIPDNVMKSLDSNYRYIIKQHRFDPENAQDNLALATLFETIRRRMFEVRSTNDQSFHDDVFSSFQHAVMHYDRFLSYCMAAISDMNVSNNYDEKVGSWNIIKHKLNFESSIKMMKNTFEADPIGNSIFFTKSLGLLADKVSEMRDPVLVRRGYHELFNTVYANRGQVFEAGYWNAILRSINSQLEEGNLLNDYLPDEFLNEVISYQPKSKDSENTVVKVEVANEMLGILGLEIMSEAVSLLSESDRDELIKYLVDEKDSDLDGIIEGIFSSGDSKDMDVDDVFTLKGTMRKRARKFLLDPRIEKLFSKMSEVDGNRYAMELALYSSLVPFGELKPETKKAMKAYHLRTEQRLLVQNGEWYLCSWSEPSILTDILAKNAILVNGRMLYKFTGKKAALCLENFVDPIGNIFKEGVWYALTDASTKAKLKGAFAEGMVAVKGLSGTWAVMRAVSDEDIYNSTDAETVMTVSKNYAEWCKRRTGRKGIVDRRKMKTDDESY